MMRMKMRKMVLCEMAIALAFATAVHAQEAFDAEKTKALFAGSEWVLHGYGWSREVTFGADGILKTSGRNTKARMDTWKPSGSRSVSDGKGEWVMSPDGKELYATGIADNSRFSAFYRGNKYPPEYPFLRGTLAKQGVVWVQQNTGGRNTLAFNGDLDVICRENGYAVKSGAGGNVFGGGHFSAGNVVYFLTQGENGETILRNRDNAIYKPEPAQPGDPLAPQMISRAKSPFNGTSWCRMDGKGKVLALTFAANGTVSDSNFPNEKPEWNPYDDGSVRYKVKEGSRKMKLTEDKKFLVREDDKAREIWFTGRQPPRVGMTETKQIKDLLGNKDKTWVNWDEGKKTVYTFDDKTANVDITVEGIKLKTVRWEALCAGCIRIGDEAFMIEGETLERVEPRLTLKQVARDSVR